MSVHVYIYAECYRGMVQCSIYCKTAEKQKFVHTTENSAAVRQNNWGLSATLFLNTMYASSL